MAMRGILGCIAEVGRIGSISLKEPMPPSEQIVSEQPPLERVAEKAEPL